MRYFSFPTCGVLLCRRLRSSPSCASSEVRGPGTVVEKCVFTCPKCVEKLPVSLDHGQRRDGFEPYGWSYCVRGINKKGSQSRNRSGFIPGALELSFHGLGTSMIISVTSTRGCVRLPDSPQFIMTRRMHNCFLEDWASEFGTIPLLH